MKCASLRDLGTEILHYPRNRDSTVQASTQSFKADPKAVNTDCLHVLLEGDISERTLH